jgi:ABC-type branched-subunit amino acid transport system ATPase component
VLGLLARFYDPDRGVVAFDGADIRAASFDSLRGQLGIVFQDSFLFNTTVRENIRMGRLTATDEEVEQAARAAEIHDLIAGLPEGYNTIVGERGSRLSGASASAWRSRGRSSATRRSCCSTRRRRRSTRPPRRRSTPRSSDSAATAL